MTLHDGAPQIPAADPGPFGTLFDLIYGATLSYAVFEYVQVILKVVARFNALKHEPWSTLPTHADSPIALRFYMVTMIVIYLVTDFGDRKKRDRWLPLKKDSHYLTQVLISSCFAASVALGSVGHFGVALPFAVAVALGSYSSYLTEWECVSPADRSFFRRESSAQAGLASVALVMWIFHMLTRGDQDALTPSYVVIFGLWFLFLVFGVQEIPRDRDHPELAERYQITIGLPKDLWKWIKHPFTAPPITEAPEAAKDGKLEHVNSKKASPDASS